MNMFSLLIDDLINHKPHHVYTTKDRILKIIKEQGVTTKGFLIEETACTQHYMDNVLRHAAALNLITVKGVGMSKVVTHKKDKPS